MPRPRLLVVASTYPAYPGDGTPAFVRDLAIAESAEYETTVLVPSIRGAAGSETEGSLTVRRFRFFPRRWEDLADGAILENLRTKKSRWLQVPFFLLFEIIAIRRVVRQFKPDVIHAHWLIPQGAAALIAAPRVPKLVTTLGGDLYGLRDPLSRRVIRAVLRNAKLATTMNLDMRDRLIDLGSTPGSTEVLPMGADLDYIRPLAAAVSREPGRVLFVGRLVEKKGLTHLIDAVRMLPDVPLALHVVGDGPLRADLEAQAAGLPITFLGALGRTELAAEYGASTVAVFPSVAAASGDQDGLPVALLEAMSAGTAVVVSRMPGLAEAVVDGDSGLVVTPGSPTELAEAIRRVVTDEATTERLAKGAAARAEEFSVPAIGRRYVELLDKVVGR